ncbi:phosphotransferase enzyme family protein [Saccharopolyspora sp. 6V]|uniref:phosphotransferase enzyme family protein n=1 Tax=Saccharopolyspora sp. 6V TaxID=2877239 RepID=UPI001CD68EE8|nr:aminoglycoside phosphotransferase family protein [Saccharopolyspora sp. 6V]MCA1194904.1 aminoglycoside phosphotransferase family protein [Saccharopolyspora sp. 6V]
MSTETTAVLRRACEQVGLNHGAAELIRAGENDLYRLPGGVVARISRPGQVSAAAKELRVTRWLAGTQVPAVRPWGEQDAPVVVGERAVTFWHELPPHEQGSTTDVAGLLRELHSLDLPDGMDLPELAPFVRVAERIDGATWLDPQDRDWLRKRLAELQDTYQELPAGIPWRLVHGDAWRGNVATTAGGPILMDFERCAYGPPEWDLVSTAVAHVTTGWLTTEQWTDYCRTYGYDVTTWDGFEVLRDIRELRMTTTAAQIAERDPDRRGQCIHRLACLQGHRGSRPWESWSAVP